MSSFLFKKKSIDPKDGLETSLAPEEEDKPKSRPSGFISAICPSPKVPLAPEVWNQVVGAGARSTRPRLWDKQSPQLFPLAPLSRPLPAQVTPALLGHSVLRKPGASLMTAPKVHTSTCPAPTGRSGGPGARDH